MAVQYQVTGRTATQISASVEAGVRDGALSAGGELPTIRSLAVSLGVSPATVASAYGELRRRGIVETAGRGGTRVRGRPPVATLRTARRPTVPPGVLDLSTGEPDHRLLPDLRPHLAALAVAEDAGTGYQRSGPLPELVELARERLRRDGVPLRAAALTVTAGALDGMERLLSAHLRPGDRVGVEDPGWTNLLDLVAALGLTAVPVPVDEEGPTPDGVASAIAAGARALVVTVRAHNPIGAAVTRSRAQALRELLRGHDGVLVIEDDHAAELSTVALHTLSGATPHWALLRSVSKPYGPDLRAAILAGDEQTVARVEGRLRLGAGWVSTILQRLVVQVWRDHAVAAQVAAARDSYEGRRTALLRALRGRGIVAHGRTGINVWIPVPDETLAVSRLRDAGFAVLPGALHRQSAPPGVRVTISPLSTSHIEPLADALAAAANPSTAAPRGV